MHTEGISNKLLKTLYGAVGAQLTALLVALAATGEFDPVQWAQVAGLALTAAAALVTSKVFVALWAAGGVQLVALLVTLMGGGAFDRAAWAQLGAVILTAAAGLLFGYKAKPDRVTAAR